MKIAEASRQHQIALEHERVVRYQCAGVISAVDSLEDAETEAVRASQELWRCWFERIPTRGDA